MIRIAEGSRGFLVEQSEAPMDWGVTGMVEHS